MKQLDRRAKLVLGAIGGLGGDVTMRQLEEQVPPAKGQRRVQAVLFELWAAQLVVHNRKRDIWGLSAQGRREVEGWADALAPWVGELQRQQEAAS